MGVEVIFSEKGVLLLNSSIKVLCFGIQVILEERVLVMKNVFQTLYGLPQRMMHLTMYVVYLDKNPICYRNLTTYES